MRCPRHNNDNGLAEKNWSLPISCPAPCPAAPASLPAGPPCAPCRGDLSFCAEPAYPPGATSQGHRRQRRPTLPQVALSKSARTFRFCTKNRDHTKRCEPASLDREQIAVDCKLARNEREPAPCSQSQSIRTGSRVDCEPRQFALQAAIGTGPGRHRTHPARNAVGSMLRLHIHFPGWQALRLSRSRDRST